MTSKKCLIKFFHKQKSKTSNSYILPVLADIVNRTKYADSDLFLSIISKQWLVHESNNKTEFDPTFGKNTSFIQISKWLDVSLPVIN